MPLMHFTYSVHDNCHWQHSFLWQYHVCMLVHIHYNKNDIYCVYSNQFYMVTLIILAWLSPLPPLSGMFAIHAEHEYIESNDFMNFKAVHKISDSKKTWDIAGLYTNLENWLLIVEKMQPEIQKIITVTIQKILFLIFEIHVQQQQLITWHVCVYIHLPQK